MSMVNTCYSRQEISDRFKVPIETTRRIIDRLGLGRRIGQSRAVFAADLPSLEIAFRTLGYLVPDPPQPVTAPEVVASSEEAS
jgi:hypothetical protein